MSMTVMPKPTNKTMIGTILDMLKQDKFYGISEEIEIAKGKFSIPQNLTQTLNQAKRELKWRLRKPST
jgi:hypothetical protein